MLTIAHQAGDDGRLFGSVTSQDIVDAIKEARGIEIDRRKVHLEEPIRTVGTRMVIVEVGDGVLGQRQDHGGRAVAAVPRGRAPCHGARLRHDFASSETKLCVKSRAPPEGLRCRT